MHAKTAVELTELLKRREISPRELQEHYLRRIEERNPELSCYLHVAREPIPDELPGPLYGLPVAFKDLTPVKNMPCTSGSLLYRDFVPEIEAAVVERTRRAGGIVLGKTNTPELGYKGVTDNQLAPPCRNPRDPRRTAGGSSGGAACAVAAGLAPLAEGTDGAGSIRIPASFCGVVGHKPTRGLVARFPVPDAFYTLSHIGPIARTVHDCALFLDVLAGHDPRDPLSLRNQTRFLEGLQEPLGSLRLAWSPDLGYARVDPDVLGRLQPLVERLGAEQVKLDWPDPEPLELDLWALTYAGRFEPDPRLDPELQEIIRYGQRLPAARAGQVSVQRTEFYSRVHRLFQEYDLLLTPTMPCGAFPVEQQRPPGVDTLFGWTPFTYPFNLTGHPALTVPAALDADGMPLGLQIVGRLGADLDCIRLGRDLEQVAKL